jgi:DeoR family transcriptional regulator, ulaG and ulaABCDEF operon transcriptional repressor
MLERERKDTIFRLLDLHGWASIHDVVEACGASEATIRRDFIEMEEAGLIRRVRGGVEQVRERPGEAGSSPLAGGSRAEPPLDMRLSVNREKKRRIARQACSYIRPWDTIIIDGGSTTFHMVEYLSSLSLTVVTNSFAIASHLIKYSGCTVILPEGTVHPSSQLILNNLSADPFANYHADMAFMGIEGITESALTNSEPLLIQSERAMILHAGELVILADESKFGKTGNLSLCPVEKATRIISTREAAGPLVDALRAKGVELVLV